MLPDRSEDGNNLIERCRSFSLQLKHDLKSCRGGNEYEIDDAFDHDTGDL
mgnify:CR=1 FL=1|jgi:hypothetical protein